MARLPELEIVNRLADAELQIEVGQLYYHYKNPDQHYRVKDFAYQVGNQKVCVIYEALYGQHITFSRELDSWLSEVESGGARVPRFTRVQ